MGVALGAETDTETLLDKVCDRTLTFLNQEVGLRAHSRAGSSERLLPDLASSLAIEGALEGRIQLRATESTVLEIMSRLGCEPGDEERAALVRDTLNEVLNIIVGGTTQALDAMGLTIQISPPLAAGSEEPAAPVVERRSIETEAGLIVLMYVAGNRRDERADG